MLGATLIIEQSESGGLNRYEKEFFDMGFSECRRMFCLCLYHHISNKTFNTVDTYYQLNQTHSSGRQVSVFND